MGVPGPAYTRVMVHMAASLTVARDLPVDMPGFIRKMDRALAQIEEESDPCFSLCDVRARSQKLKEGAAALAGPGRCRVII